MLKEDLILVTDMQKAYLKGQKWECPNINSVIEKIVQLLSECNCNVMFTAFTAPQNPTGQWIDYNYVNQDINSCPYKNEIIDRLKCYIKKYPLVFKDKYSSLSNKSVTQAVYDIIKNGGRVVITGVVSECCVLSTAMAAIDLGGKVIYIKDAVAGSSKKHEKAVELIMRGMEPIHAKVMTLREYIEE